MGIENFQHDNDRKWTKHRMLPIKSKLLLEVSVSWEGGPKAGPNLQFEWRMELLLKETKEFFRGL